MFFDTYCHAKCNMASVWTFFDTFWHVLTRFWHVFDTFLTCFWHFFDTRHYFLTRDLFLTRFDSFWHVLTLSQNLVNIVVLLRSSVFWHAGLAYMVHFARELLGIGVLVGGWGWNTGVKQVFWHKSYVFDTFWYEHLERKWWFWFLTRGRVPIFLTRTIFDSFWHEFEHLSHRSAGVRKLCQKLVFDTFLTRFWHALTQNGTPMAPEATFWSLTRFWLVWASKKIDTSSRD